MILESILCNMNHLVWHFRGRERGRHASICPHYATRMRIQSPKALHPRASIGQAVHNDGRSRMTWLAVRRLLAASRTDISSVSNRHEQMNASTYVILSQCDRPKARRKQDRQPLWNWYVFNTCWLSDGFISWRLLSCRIWRRVVCQKYANVSKEG
jgi:hypothetical protein